MFNEDKDYEDFLLDNKNYAGNDYDDFDDFNDVWATEHDNDVAASIDDTAYGVFLDDLFLFIFKAIILGIFLYFIFYAGNTSIPVIENYINRIITDVSNLISTVINGWNPNTIVDKLVNYMIYLLEQS